MFKTIISWVIAFVIAAILLQLLTLFFGIAIEVLFKLIMIIPLVVLAIPFFFIIRKKVLK